MQGDCSCTLQVAKQSQYRILHGCISMCKIGGAPVNVFWFAVIPWEADLYFLCYKFWLNVGTTKDLVTLVTSAIHHNSTAKDCKNKPKYIL